MTTRPLRILYSFPSALGAPGIGTTAYNQVRSLNELGHEIRVFTTSLSLPLPSRVHVTPTMSLLGQRLPHRAIGVSRAYRYHDRLVASFIRRRAASFDLFHGWPAGCLKSFEACNQVGLPSFRESPNPHTAAAFEAAGQAASELGISVLPGHSHFATEARLEQEEAEYHAASYILSPSEYVRESYLTRGFTPDRILRHRYGFDPATFPQPQADVERSFAAAFVGSGEPRKGLHFALQAWLEAGLETSGQIVIAGTLEADYERAISDLLEAARARQLGFTRNVGAILRSSRTLLLPSVSEGSALVCYEAMASGAVPFVSTAAGAPVIDAVDGFLHNVGDTKQLALQLALLRDGDQRLESMRDAGLSRRDELTWLAGCSQLVSAYRQGLAPA